MAKTYETYKDSGVAWIGEIPSEWKVVRLKNYLSLINTASSNSTKIGLENIESQTGKYIETGSTFECNGIDFKKRDIVYGKLRPYLQKVWEATFDGNAVGDFYVFRTKKATDSTFIKYLFLSDGFTKEVAGSTYGAKMPRVSSDFIMTMNCAFPSKETQQTIASFLDKKCGEIDALIALQEEMISELQAYKQSVITEAVTKGLNPNAKMKDSDVEWIGKIPEDWKVCRIKNLFRLSTGTTPKSYEDILEGEETINWYTPSDIIDGGNELWESKRKLSKRIVDNESIKVYPKHSLIYVGIGASAGKVGYSHEVGYCNQQITALITKGDGNKYYYYLLNAISAMIRDNAYFTTLPIINNSYLGQREIPCPPLSEQQAIASYLDEKTARIDSLISLKQEKIAELKDYKKSVIYEYVTGKKMVDNLSFVADKGEKTITL